MIYNTRYFSGRATLLMLAMVIVIALLDCIIVAAAGIRGLFAFILVMCPFFALPFLIKYFQQRIELEIAGDTIMIRYLSQPFCDHAADRQIQVSDIQSYVLSGGKGKGFTLYLKDNTKFDCAIGVVDTTGDFERITTAIISMINATGKVAG